jgi:hypothetical protein
MTPIEIAELKERIRRGLELLQEFYEGRYRGALARSKREEDDLFMLLVFSESMGIPNPAGYYTLELLPILYERFHDWHLRMGMEKSPLDHFQCC